MNEHILVADDEAGIRESIAEMLESEGYTVFSAADGEEALAILKEESIDILLTDLKMPKMSGTELIVEARTWSPTTLAIIMTAFASVETAVSALRLGAADYLMKPLDFDELLVIITSLLEKREALEQNRYLKEQVDKKFNFNFIIGDSEPMKKLYKMIARVGPTKSSVFVSGKSGTGKELVARAIHQHSDRSQKAFLAINCGAIPESLFESELFGHKKGAFTGAQSDRAGVFVLADKGTLFLDEIGEMPLAMQVKLLRVLQEGEVQPVGASSARKVDVRIVSATNRDIRKEIEAGNFREDLFYRLNIIELNVPSLKDRTGDIPLLCSYFLSKFNKELNRAITGISPKAMRCLNNYEWPGQVRELENVIERAVLMSDEDTIGVDDLPIPLQKCADQDDSLQEEFEKNSMPLNSAVEEFEKKFISHVYETSGRQKGETARLLGVDPSTLYRKMDKYGIRNG